MNANANANARKVTIRYACDVARCENEATIYNETQGIARFACVDHARHGAMFTCVALRPLVGEQTTCGKYKCSIPATVRVNFGEDGCDYMCYRCAVITEERHPYVLLTQLYRELSMCGHDVRACDEDGMCRKCDDILNDEDGTKVRVVEKRYVVNTGTRLMIFTTKRTAMRYARTFGNIRTCFRYDITSYKDAIRYGLRIVNVIN